MSNSLKIGIIAGLIAGAMAGIVPLVSNIVYSDMGINELKSPGTIILANEVIVNIGMNAIWGAIFGIIFAIFFNRIPGKGISKGLLIGVIYASLSVIRTTFFLLAYGYWDILWGSAYILSTTLDKFVYGILFVILYKRLMRYEK